MAPMILASVLAPMLETSLQQSLLISQGSLAIFFTRPIAAGFVLLALASMVRGFWVQIRDRRGEALADGDD
jgi:putative tricarboxylic transport membrane protein